MLSAIRRRITFANVAMTLALVFAMSGGAYAAGKYLITSTKQIKPGVLASLKGRAGANGANGAQGPAGPQGPAGKEGPAGKDGEKGAAGEKGEPGKEGEKGAAGKSGLPGTVGATGPAGAAGPAGPAGPTGPQGSPWTDGGTLPTGATETGVWTASTVELKEQAEILVPISFPIPLASSSEKYFYFTEKQTENEEFEVGGKPSGCSWKASNPTSRPAAPAGTLCIFAQVEANKNVDGTPFVAPVGGEPFTVGYGPTGSKLQFDTSSSGAQVVDIGVWAVTAP
jgi:Collagen triple helix repeat (20 copies)